MPVPNMKLLIREARRLGAEAYRHGGDTILYHPTWGRKVSCSMGRKDGSRILLKLVKQLREAR